MTSPASRPARVDPGRDPLRLLDALAETVLGGADAERIVQRVSGLLGLPVALLDTALEAGAWSAPPGLRLDAPASLSPAVRDVPAVRDALGGLGPARPAAVVPPCPARGVGRRHLVAALVVDGATAGYLDVGEMGRPLTEPDATLACQAAVALSLLRLADDRAAASRARTRDDLVADLLRGSRAAPDVRRLAADAGLDMAVPHLVVRCPVAADRSAASCRDAVASALAAGHGPGGGAGTGAGAGAAPPAMAEPGAVLVLLALPADPGPPEVRAAHDRLRGRIDALAALTGVGRAVVSGACHEPADFPTAAAETRDVDGIAAALADGDPDGCGTGVVGVTELSTLRLVVNGGRADVALRFAEQCIGPVRRNDDETGGDLVETLRTYVACGAQVRATARALGVHENTVRYRLGRVEHVSGLDIRSLDALLAVRLAFQVQALTASGR